MRTGEIRRSFKASSLLAGALFVLCCLPGCPDSPSECSDGDCAPEGPSVCGNGVCEQPSEDGTNCPGDCAPVNACTNPSYPVNCHDGTCWSPGTDCLSPVYTCGGSQY